MRYPVACYVGPRIFERVRLDVNFIGPDDPRPTEDAVIRRNPFGFVGADALTVPMLPPAHQLAEKLHAYLRDYGDGGGSSRPKDVFDSVVMTGQVELPTAGAVAGAAEQTFDMRRTPWPPSEVPDPPDYWRDEWNALLEDSDDPLASHTTLVGAIELLRCFWLPILRDEVDGGADWDPSSGAWVAN